MAITEPERYVVAVECGPGTGDEIYRDQMGMLFYTLHYGYAPYATDGKRIWRQ